MQRFTPMCSVRPQRSDGFRLGKYALVVSEDDAGVHYRYDPARPESVLARTAGGRCAADRGRPQESHAHDRARAAQRAGRALHRLPDSRPAGHEPDELRHVGHRLCAGGHAAAQAAEALHRHAHAPHRFSAGAGQQPAGADADRSWRCCWASACWSFTCGSRARCWRFCWSARWERFRSAASACSPPAARRRSKASAG